MKIENRKKQYKQKIILLIEFIFINLYEFINSVDTSLLEINYFKERKNLYYVNAMNNNKGDIYFEFWGEEIRSAILLV